MIGGNGSSTSDRAELVVVGGGPGGYAAAFLAADLGLDVTLVDPAPNPGGVCLYHGCIPSKTLLHVARLIHEARAAADWGVEFGEPRLDLDRLRSFKQRVVDKLTGGLGQLTRQRRVRHVRARARLVDAHTLELDSSEHAPGSLAFEHAILATGSRPTELPGLPRDSGRVLDSTSALELRDVPGSLLVVGGGYIGLELGSVYAALGSRVTVVEMTPGLLPGVDRDLVRPLAKRLERDLAAILLETRVAGVEPRAEGLAVRFEGRHAGDAESTFEAMLVAVGRKPNHEGLGLENTRVSLTDEGFVEIDAQGRTAEPSIWAIGDLVGQPMLAHKASHEGRIAAEAIAGHKVAFEAQAVPAVVFTDPEVAWCGLTEDRARDVGREVRVARFPWAASGRAATLGRDDGVTKLVIDPESERVLGVGLAGPGAGELIAEGVLAVEMGALARDLALTLHPHPTLSETLMEAAQVFFGQSTHVYRPRK